MRTLFTLATISFLLELHPGSASAMQVPQPPATTIEEKVLIPPDAGSGFRMAGGCGGPDDIIFDCLHGDDGYLGGWPYYRYHHRDRSRHVQWCKARYKTYDPGTDTFIGKGRKRYRCNSPYDGRR